MDHKHLRIIISSAIFITLTTVLTVFCANTYT